MSTDLKLFFVTDIHGSETCWRKFLNAGAFYGADVVIVGGDITGKAMVPIVQHAGGWETTMFGEHVSLATSAEVAEVERKVRNRGYYPQQMTESEYAELRADPAALDRRFTKVMLEETQRWIGMADDKLRGKVQRVIVCPANDDMFELDPLLHQEGHVVETSGDAPSSSRPGRWSTRPPVPESRCGCSEGSRSGC